MFVVAYCDIPSADHLLVDIPEDVYHVVNNTAESTSIATFA